MKKKQFFGTVKFILIYVLVVAVIFLIVAGCSWLELKHDRKAYNDGICTECGGNYVFSGATHVKNSPDDCYYTCDKCGHTIKLHRIMK